LRSNKLYQIKKTKKVTNNDVSKQYHKQRGLST
jgi:hypothetical protein